jgi:ribosomal protein L29
MKKELLKKSKNDLEKELNEKRVIIHNIRFGMAGSKSKNVKEQRNVRKDIARIKTALKNG